MVGFVFNLLRTTKKVYMNYDLAEDTDEIFLRWAIHGTFIASFFIWLQDIEEYMYIVGICKVKAKQTKGRFEFVSAWQLHTLDSAIQA